jgi:ABC-type transporter Mla maintaining outer membrane lipid asymmetry ATPase subunit MlaF
MRAAGCFIHHHLSRGVMEKTDSTETMIEMRGVAVAALRDQSLVVAEDINWQVVSGQSWVIGGLQGTGKSDFLMMTGGLMPPLAGTYRLFGEAMPIFEEARLKTRLRMGLVFENGQLFNQLTVTENITLPLRYHLNLPQEEAREQVQPILDSMELGPWADSTPGTLGRNWQKRVGLARALVLKPDLLLVDSPLTGLDLRHIHWWREFLEVLARGHPFFQNKPVTLVVTAADFRPWKNRARQFAVLKNKRLTILGDWSQLESGNAELVHELLAN